MDAHQLRSRLGVEEFDYQTLMNQLKDYKAPKQKMNEWLKSGSLIRVKKGIYIFGDEVRRESYSKKLLANWIYGPSYISLESALSHYGLIPERVEVLTSITSKKDKSFQTPIGDFTYRYLNIKKYPLGILRESISGQRHVLMASVEKALIDQLSLSLDQSIENRGDLEETLFDNLRIDEDELLKRISYKNLKQISQHYKKKSITQLLNYVEAKKGSQDG